MQQDKNFVALVDIRNELLRESLIRKVLLNSSEKPKLNGHGHHGYNQYPLDPFLTFIH